MSNDSILPDDVVKIFAEAHLDPKLIMLYTHWCVADSVKVSITSPIPGAEELGDDFLAQAAPALSSFYRVLVYYALLYVVLDTYQINGDHFEAVDNLLDKDRVNELRRLRNGMFHIQDQPLTPKIWDFLLRDDSEQWIRALGSAFEEYFRGRLPIDAIVAARGSNDA